MKRKAFIYTAGRITILGIMALFAGFLAARKQLTLDSCSEDSPCGNCIKLRDCKFPEAKKHRRDG